MSNFYGGTSLTGGGTGALDAIDGAALADLDGAIVIVDGNTYTYWLDVDSAAGESSPGIIAPDSNGGDKRWILSGIVTPVNPIFVDRGDPAAFDFAVGNLTTDGTWRNLDLSSIIPVDAVSVHIVVYMTDNLTGQKFRLRKDGNSNTINIQVKRTQVADITIELDTWVAVGANRLIEYWAENTTWTDLNVIVCAWLLA